MRVRAKHAAPAGGFGKTLKDVFLNPGMMTLMAAPFVTHGVNTWNTRRLVKERAAQKVEGFREMVDLHPHFKKRDPNEVARIYNSLHNISPHVARDPMYAGAWVDSVLENKLDGQSSHQALLAATKDLGQLQKNVSEVARYRRTEDQQLGATVGETLRGMGQVAESNMKGGIQRSWDTLQDEKRRIDTNLKKLKEVNRAIEGNPKKMRDLQRFRDAMEKSSSGRQPYSDLDRLFDALKV